MGKEEVLKQIKEMSVLELAELVKALQQEFGISAASVAAAAPVAVAGGGTTAAPAQGPTAVEEEKAEFTVVLQEIGANKINVIKAVREVTPLGLREAKELVESAPKPVREGVSKEEAQQIKEKLEAAGAKVVVQ